MKGLVPLSVQRVCMYIYMYLHTCGILHVMYVNNKSNINKEAMYAIIVQP